MSEIPADIMKAVQAAWETAWSKAGSTNADSIRDAIADGISSERNRCLSILQSIEPMNPSEAHMLETIVRRIRGSE